MRTEEAELPDTTPLDQWSEDDIQNFEDGVERYGKNFFKVHGHMQGKYSVEMLVLFYYARWKSSAGFKCWLARRSKEDEEELQECVSCGKPESDEGDGPGIGDDLIVLLAKAAGDFRPIGLVPAIASWCGPRYPRYLKSE